MSCYCERRRIQIRTGVGYANKLNQVSLLFIATKLEKVRTYVIASVTGFSLDTICVVQGVKSTEQYWSTLL